MEQFTKIWDSGNRQNFGGLVKPCYKSCYGVFESR